MTTTIVSEKLENTGDMAHWLKAKGRVRFVPGFNGSPAWMEAEEAIKHFWADLDSIERGRKVGLDLPASKIEVQLRTTTFRGRRDRIYYLHIRTDDHALVRCPECGGPIGERAVKCIWCRNYID